jgi:hypothetical protein
MGRDIVYQITDIWSDSAMSRSRGKCGCIMCQNHRYLSECVSSISRGSWAVVDCTKVTDIWSDFARSINRGARAGIVCIKISDICSDCALSINRVVRAVVVCTKITDICQSALCL